jgi:integrase
MLTAVVNEYVALRRSLGAKFVEEAEALRSYAKFAAARGDKHVLTGRAIEWAALATTASRRENRLRLVVAFAIHARSEDPHHDLPPRHVFAGARSRYRRPPYIYAPEAVGTLLAAAARLGPAGSLRPDTYSTLFALLTCAGLRVSEALRLRLGDFSDGSLVVRSTKFGKTRLVPLHPTATEALTRYLARRNAACPVDDHVFVSLRGNPLKYKYVYRTFLGLVSGWSAGPNRPRPNLHGLRHTFAVRSLEDSPTGRDHVGWHLRALSTYLGHVSVASTYWYLRSTPQLMRDLADVCAPTFEEGQS